MKIMLRQRRFNIGPILLLAYAAFFAVGAWTAEEPDDGPGAAAVMVTGFLAMGVYYLWRLIIWLSRPRSEPRGFPGEPLPRGEAYPAAGAHRAAAFFFLSEVS